MPGQRQEIEDKLKSLPESFSADEIESMYLYLKKDLNFMKLKGVGRVEMEARLHKKHEKFAYSYPTIFFKILRDEMDPHIFKSLMQIKRRTESGELTNEDAKKAVIDGAKAQVMSNPDRPRRKVEPGSTVQEIVVKCKVDDN